ncbi:hypothetical protein [Streptomyces phaeochromogenes]
MFAQGGAQRDVHAVGMLVHGCRRRPEPDLAGALDGLVQTGLDVAAKYQAGYPGHIAVPQGSPTTSARTVDVVGPAGVVVSVADDVEYAYSLRRGTARFEQSDEIPAGRPLGGAFDDQTLPADLMQT